MPDYKEALFELKLIENKIGRPLTEEQRAMAIDFTRDLIVFANPGTGKTHTLTAGILLAQTYYKIDPTKIFCMSYTNAATNEIKGRYTKLCKNLRASTGVEFGTFHHLSNAILKSAYGDGWTFRSKIDSTDKEALSEYIREIAPDYPFNDRILYKIVSVIDTLNSSFIFDESNIEMRYDFLQLKLTVEQFQYIRKKWFEYGSINKIISRGEIPLYCLQALIAREHVAEMWKGKYDIMIVDEFQDLSLLDLEILSRVSKKLIVVGDMKQQIYVFSGACPEIVDAYKKMKPDAIECKLTQSFRCTQAIADFATKIITPNLTEDAHFNGRLGTSDKFDESISIVDRRNLNWSEIFKDTNPATLNDNLILYRNEASTIPVIEELYKRGIPYRCPKFKTVMEIPVLNTLCILANVAWQPRSYDAVCKALSIFPEFISQRFNVDSYAKIVRTGKTIYDVDRLLEVGSSHQIIGAIREAGERIAQKKSAGNVLMALKPVYEKWFMPREYYPNDEQYYLNMAAGICNVMTYPEMVTRENDKYAQLVKYQDADMGVRCYTMHSSKGLEGKNVYLLDVNEGIFPNVSKLNKKVENGCVYDASLDVRAERNLLYVAVTRAKDKLVVSYSNNQLATMVTDPEDNVYRQYDEIYKEHHVLFDDIGAFKRLFYRGA